MEWMILLVSGFVAGSIDAIAGGGGLITLPILSYFLGAGAHAIGTNKIVGVTGALMAFLVYRRHHPLHLKRGIVFIVFIGVGSFIGSHVTPLIPRDFFRWFLIGVSPILLLLIWNKKLWMHELHAVPRGNIWLAVTGTAVGFYDGFFGPGGGTFMLLGLLWVVRMQLLPALLLSKLANTVSAGVALGSFAFGGYVHWVDGCVMGCGMLFGAWLGAKYATKKAEKIVRPVMTLVVLLLVLSLLRVH